MKSFRLRSAARQVADHIKESILDGTMNHEIPGVHNLAARLGVNHKTVSSALAMLCKEGLLESQGPGRSLAVAAGMSNPKTAPLRIGILKFDRTDQAVSMFVELKFRLENDGHQVFYLPKALTELGMDLKRVTAMVLKHPADAWIVIAGTRDVLEWFSLCGKPTMAFVGRAEGLPIPYVGPRGSSSHEDAAKALLSLGHRRIVLLVREDRRLPFVGEGEKAFLLILESHGVAPSDYNLPQWSDDPESLRMKLESLFKVTPPTAIVVHEAKIFWAVERFLNARGLRVPQDVSLICLEADTTFEWCVPPITHVKIESPKWISRVRQWANHSKFGIPDIKKLETKAFLVHGGTIGPPPKGS